MRRVDLKKPREKKLAQGGQVKSWTLYVVRPINRDDPVRVERWTVANFRRGTAYVTVRHLDGSRERLSREVVFDTYDEAAKAALKHNDRAALLLQKKAEEMGNAVLALQQRRVRVVERKPVPPFSDEDLAKMLG